MSSEHSITARFEDGVELTFSCGEGENILAAAMRQEVRLLCQCRKAYCGSCKALCTEGDYHLGKLINVQVLPPNEEEDGVVVTCDTFPRSEMVLEFPYTSDRLGSMKPAAECSARVVAVEQISSVVYRFVIAPVDAATGARLPFSFVAGQYVEIGIPDTDKARAFSISTAPADSGELEFLIRLVPGGAFSHYLKTRAKIGENVTLRGPMGEFVLRPSPRARALVGGSTGLAPLLSMLRDVAASGRDQDEYHLFFGMQDPASMFFETELRALAGTMRNLTVHLALMAPPEGWDGFVGNSVAAFAAYFADRAEKPYVYLCGPGPMVDAAIAACQRLAIPDAQIYREEFVASGS